MRRFGRAESELLSKSTVEKRTRRQRDTDKFGDRGDIR